MKHEAVTVRLRPKSAQAPVVFFANGIGHSVLALPALRAFCALFPGRLSLVTRHASYAAMLSRLPFRRHLELASGTKSSGTSGRSCRSPRQSELRSLHLATLRALADLTALLGPLGPSPRHCQIRPRPQARWDRRFALFWCSCRSSGTICRTAPRCGGRTT